MPKVHNKPIKRPKKGSNKESKRQPKGTLVWRIGLSGVPPDSVRCTRVLNAEVATFGKLGGRSAIIHRTVRCASGAMATSRTTVDCNAFNARLRAQRIEHAREAHPTVYRPCAPDSLEAPQVRAPTVEPQWSADVAGAPDSVRCAMRLQPSNGHFVVVAAINTPERELGLHLVPN